MRDVDFEPGFNGRTEEIIFDALVRTTERAVLVKSDEVPAGEMWIPHSVVADYSVADDGSGVMEIASWFIEQNCIG